MPVLAGRHARCQRPPRRFPDRPRFRLRPTAPPLPSLPGRSADSHTSPHCRGLPLLTGAPHRRHLMTTVSIPPTKSLTSSFALPKGKRRSLSEAVVLALQKRWRPLPPTKQSPSQVEGDSFYRRPFPAPDTFPDSRQPDRHSIPIALGPAQFNEFYRQCPPQVFPTLRIFFWGRAPPIECFSLGESSRDPDTVRLARFTALGARPPRNTDRIR